MDASNARKVFAKITRCSPSNRNYSEYYIDFQIWGIATTTTTTTTPHPPELKFWGWWWAKKIQKKA